LEFSESTMAYRQGMQERLLASLELHKGFMETTGICFDKCISSPGRTTSPSEKTCLWNCAQRLLESSYFIEKRYADMYMSNEKSSH